MPKFIDRKSLPTKEAIQWNHEQSITLKKGDWVIMSSNGTTTYCEDKWFQENYMEVK